MIHALSAAMDPAANAFARLWPQARVTCLLDDSLSEDLAAAGVITPEITQRFLDLADYVVGNGAEAILFTCSAFGAAIDAVKAAARVPVLKPNEAGIAEALEAGPRIVLLATFEPTLASMDEEIAVAARERGIDLDLVARFVPGAMAALQRGDGAGHDAAIAAAAAQAGACDALLLSQFSMARAGATIPRMAGRRVVTTPDSAVRRLRTLLDAQIGANAG
jgi:glutamate racemase